jgi:hypothetical protein
VTSPATPNGIQSCSRTTWSVTSGAAGGFVVVVVLVVVDVVVVVDVDVVVMDVLVVVVVAVVAVAAVVARLEVHAARSARSVTASQIRRCIARG